MAINEIHRYDIGTAFDVQIRDETDVAVNLSGATTLYYFLQKPTDPEILTKSVNFLTDGSDGRVRYVTQVGDLDQPGTWRLQAYIVLPSGKWYSDVTMFKVFDNIKNI